MGEAFNTITLLMSILIIFIVCGVGVADEQEDK